MQNRTTAVIAVALATTALVACSSRSASAVSSTATVTVDGKDSTMHIVKCTQLEWYRMINIGSDFAGAKIVIDQRAHPVTAESVRIQNLNGFTGMYSRGGDGNADLRLSGDKFTITGTAHGYKADKPGDAATATFKIVTAC
ncbi:hypothetical protein BB737_00605 [Mycobacterium avium subsp. hominissuis]|nr:lipoprotein LpqH [Mycobacterium avium]APA74613.1 lipoprotein LpqH [Mycobacterium avium subsp. hominissuis]ATO61576.2 lipoprotein LpqH [Mycobacterium avium subsp. hominissuis]ATO66129.1 lipoprotein LpqH [Mycobacterium avium subsp. hominissuis]ATO70715.1 lipoprotein LpqH [Mycobacterium avium subsp. hominissuis]PBJ41743.1 hypothetical protein BI294_04320 [Mycobacterium avium subsp. hominissuis]